MDVHTNTINSAKILPDSGPVPTTRASRSSLEHPAQHWCLQQHQMSLTAAPLCSKYKTKTKLHYQITLQLYKNQFERRVILVSWTNVMIIIVILLQL